MKALTLTQPYASLVASGAKRWETRSWRTRYRGPLAIHAAAGFPPDARALCAVEPFRWRLLALTLCSPSDLDRPQEVVPLGAVVGLTWLEDVVATEDIRDELDDEERAFGDYSAGRYAWKLRQPVELDAPVAYRGALGLWNLPDDLIPERYRRAILHPGVS